MLAQQNCFLLQDIKTLVGHSHQVTSLCYVGADRLCSASADNTLSLWNLAVGHRSATWLYTAHYFHLFSQQQQSKQCFCEDLRVIVSSRQFVYMCKYQEVSVVYAEWCLLLAEKRY